MIASILTLDNHAIRQYNLYDAYAIHRVVYDLFPSTTGKFLYYHDQQVSRQGMRIILLSEEQPAVPHAGSIESKLVQPSFLEHSAYAFKVRLNPVARNRNHARSIRRQDELIQWFTKKQIGWGFEADLSSLELSNLGVAEIKGKENVMVFNECTYSGVLEVIDRPAFVRNFCEGLGRGKAFGFGLLQLQPIYR